MPEPNSTLVLSSGGVRLPATQACTLHTVPRQLLPRESTWPKDAMNVTQAVNWRLRWPTEANNSAGTNFDA